MMCFQRFFQIVCVKYFSFFFKFHAECLFSFFEMFAVLFWSIIIQWEKLRVGIFKIFNFVSHDAEERTNIRTQLRRYKYLITYDSLINAYRYLAQIDEFQLEFSTYSIEGCSHISWFRTYCGGGGSRVHDCTIKGRRKNSIQVRKTVQVAKLFTLVCLGTMHSLILMK